MKFLIVAASGLPHVGGMEVVVDHEVKALVAGGHEVTLLTSDNDGAGLKPRYPDTVRIIRCRAWHFFERYFQIPYPIFFPTLLPTLWREVGKADLVHAHSAIQINTALALIFAWLRSVPRLLTEHTLGQSVRSGINCILERTAFATVGRLTIPRASCVAAVNSRVLAFLRTRVPTRTPGILYTVPIDREIFRPPSDLERREARKAFGFDDKPKALFVGRLIPDKGVDLLLQSHDSRYDLVFCGPGRRPKLRNQTTSGVYFFSPRSQPELAKLYHAADVVVLPSCREGFPLVTKEALACGLPVVLAYDPGYQHHANANGLNFCERTPDSIRSTILRTLRSERPILQGPGSERSLFPAPEEWLKHLYSWFLEAQSSFAPGARPLAKPTFPVQTISLVDSFPCLKETVS